MAFAPPAPYRTRAFAEKVAARKIAARTSEEIAEIVGGSDPYFEPDGSYYYAPARAQGHVDGQFCNRPCLTCKRSMDIRAAEIEARTLASNMGFTEGSRSWRRAYRAALDVKLIGLGVAR